MKFDVRYRTDEDESEVRGVYSKDELLKLLAAVESDIQQSTDDSPNGVWVLEIEQI